MNEIVLDRNIETPFYYYDRTLLRNTLEEVNRCTSKRGFIVHYALKANSNIPIIEEIQKAGLYIDCVSGNEIQFAIDQGFRPDQIVFSGVGKTDKEIALAIEHDICALNCESFQEIEVINEIAIRLNRKTRIAFRLNPEIDAKTHPNITTGLKANKFGINHLRLNELLELVTDMPNLELVGLHFHIGSQILELSVYSEFVKRVNEIVDRFESTGRKLRYLNLGGGLGVDYIDPKSNSIPDFEKFFSYFETGLRVSKNTRIHFELGRSIVAQCGFLVSEVLYIKNTHYKRFAIVDGGMTELMRPALYGSHHHIENISNHMGEKSVFDVVGPICESTDSFGKEVSLSEPKRGDRLIIYSCGAYGEVLSNNYNFRSKAKAVYSD